MTTHQDHQGTAKIVGEQWHRNGGNDAPDDERMPLPLPDGVEETQRMVAQVLDLLAGHGQAMGVEEMHA